MRNLTFVALVLGVFFMASDACASNEFDMRNFEEMSWDISENTGGTFELVSDPHTQGASALKIEMNSSYWVKLTGNYPIDVDLADYVEGVKMAIDIFSDQTPWWKYVGNVQLYLKPVNREWYDWVGRFDITTIIPATSETEFTRYQIVLPDTYAQMLKDGPVNIQLAFSASRDNTNFWVDRLRFCDVDSNCCDDEVDDCWTWDANENFPDFLTYAWDRIFNDPEYNGDLDMDDVVVTKEEEEEAQQDKIFVGLPDDLTGEVVLDCVDEECDSYTGAFEVQEGGSPGYCSEMGHTQNWIDCDGNVVENIYYTYEPVGSAQEATYFGCPVLPALLPALKCPETSRHGELNEGVCAAMEGYEEVGFSGNDDYANCINAGHDEFLCQKMVQNCITEVHCPDDARVGAVIDDPSEAEVALSDQDKADMEDDLQSDEPYDEVNDDNEVKFFPCDFGGTDGPKTGSGFGDTADNDDSVKGIKDNSSIKDFEYKKGSDKWNIFFNASYEAVNGFQQGQLSEGSKFGLNTAFNANFGVNVFNKEISIIEAGANAGAGFCGVNAGFNFELFEVTQAGKTIRYPEDVEIQEKCEEALNSLGEAQKLLNQELWNYKLFSQYYNAHADTETETKLATFSENGYINSISEQDVLDRYNKLKDNFENKYRDATSKIKEKIEGVFGHDGEEQLLKSIRIWSLGEDEDGDGEDDGYSIRSPEFEKSIPIGPFSLVVAGQVAGGIHAYADLNIAVKLKNIDGLSIPAPSPTLGIALNPGLDAGGWVFVGVGIDFGVGGASVGIRGNITLLDISLPVEFGFGVEPRVKETSDNVLEWGILFYRHVGIDITMLSGSIDLELRAWIKILWKTFKKSWRKNLTSWPGIRKEFTLDEAKSDFHVILETPNVLDMPKLISNFTVPTPDHSNMPMFSGTYPGSDSVNNKAGVETLIEKIKAFEASDDNANGWNYGNNADDVELSNGEQATPICEGTIIF